ncbi:MAG: carboxypeptidase-like regulatory domain-containing protein [Bryobacteraceae bacterium]
MFLSIFSPLFRTRPRHHPGTVTDQSGAAVPDATVTARNTNTGLTQIVPTGADGVYNILYLPVGTYALLTELVSERLKALA